MKDSLRGSDFAATLVEEVAVREAEELFRRTGIPRPTVRFRDDFKMVGRVQWTDEGPPLVELDRDILDEPVELLRFLLAHEISHLTRGHLVQGWYSSAKVMLGTAGLFFFSAAGSAIAFTAVVTGWVLLQFLRAVDSTHSIGAGDLLMWDAIILVSSAPVVWLIVLWRWRNRETEADAFAWRDHGRPMPVEYLEWERGRGRNTAPSRMHVLFASTHPALEDRLRAVNRLMDTRAD